MLPARTTTSPRTTQQSTTSRDRTWDRTPSRAVPGAGPGGVTAIAKGTSVAVSVAMRVRLQLVVAVWMALALASCGGDEPATPPTNTPPGPSPMVSPSNEPATPAGTPPGPSPVASPHNEPTTTPALQVIVRTIATGTAAEILQLWAPVPTACASNPVGVGSPPRCPQGTQPGDMIPLRRALVCSIVSEEELVEARLDLYAAAERTLLGVYRDTRPPSDGDSWLPRGDFAVVVDQPTVPAGALFRVAGGAIVAVEFGCGNSGASVIAKFAGQEPIPVD